ncbi:hypothetical protein BDQ12DRAFT_682166 [Crucibulum laeve]|uniref:Uncharacterized protein n=1 Tax=Crucibulum laeve TaxID=68775 RepID=A0A5C3M2P2_9AGAR|nr:hypothetical protein BDQ12DRAFT_682166 [Crucibulum laeve]
MPSQYNKEHLFRTRLPDVPVYPYILPPLTQSEEHLRRTHSRPVRRAQSNMSLGPGRSIPTHPQPGPSTSFLNVSTAATSRTAVPSSNTSSTSHFAPLRYHSPSPPPPPPPARARPKAATHYASMSLGDTLFRPELYLKFFMKRQEKKAMKRTKSFISLS